MVIAAIECGTVLPTLVLSFSLSYVLLLPSLALPGLRRFLRVTLVPFTCAAKYDVILHA